jgi:hypothetical protein
MTAQATVAEKKWMSRVAAMGCICARLRFDRYEPATVHHITDCGRRLGHFFTIPLSPWSHQGYCLPGKSGKQMEAIYGPSLAKNKREFERVFGTELELLEKVKSWLGSQPNPA